MRLQSLAKRVGFCVTLGAMCAGCIIIPTDYHTPDSRTNVREETTITIIPGQTTKEDIFLALGEPDEVSPDGRQLVYHWNKVKAIWVVVPGPGPPTSFGGGGGSGQLKKEYYLIITFDERGAVMHRVFQSRWF